MTPEQLAGCRSFLRRSLPDELHHGDAIGADSDIHRLAAEQGIRVVLHPPTKASDRSFSNADESRPELPYMARNKAIVNETDLLLATPNGPEVTAKGSGTWRTIRCARREGKRVVIISPNGEVEVTTES